MIPTKMALTVYVDVKVYTPEQSNKQPLYVPRRSMRKWILLDNMKWKLGESHQVLQVFVRLLNEYFVYAFN